MYQIVQLYSGDALVHARNDLLGDGSSVNMVWVETITQSGDPCSDLIELDVLLASIYQDMSKASAARSETIHTAFPHVHRSVGYGIWLWDGDGRESEGVDDDGEIKEIEEQ